MACVVACLRSYAQSPSHVTNWKFNGGMAAATVTSTRQQTRRTATRRGRLRDRTVEGVPVATPAPQPGRQGTVRAIAALEWAPACSPGHVDAIETADRLFGCLCQAVSRVHPSSGVDPFSCRGRVEPLATGGAMAVYKLTVESQGRAFALAVKIPHQRPLVYAEPAASGSHGDTTADLLDTLAGLADTADRRAPGLFPRCGGAWHWRDATGAPRHLLIEEFIPGVSVERLLLRYEQELLAGGLDAAGYARRRARAERLAVAAYVRLWDALGRRLFTTDPSPWNVLVRGADEGGGAGEATIIDLHSLRREADFPYVVQRLAAVYGLREEVLERALLPGVIEALGREEGRRLLVSNLPHLETAAAQARRNLGVDTLQPLLRVIRRLT